VKAIRFILMLPAREMMALTVVGAIILLATAAWQFLTGGAP
jgi:hypothetical protein